MNLRKFILLIILIIARTFTRMTPGKQIRTPAYFVFYLSAITITTIVVIQKLDGCYSGQLFYLCLNLWGVVIFSNLCEAIVECYKK